MTLKQQIDFNYRIRNEFHEPFMFHMIIGVFYFLSSILTLYPYGLMNSDELILFGSINLTFCIIITLTYIIPFTSITEDNVSFSIQSKLSLVPFDSKLYWKSICIVLFKFCIKISITLELMQLIPTLIYNWRCICILSFIPILTYLILYCIIIFSYYIHICVKK